MSVQAWIRCPCGGDIQEVIGSWQRYILRCFRSHFQHWGVFVHVFMELYTNKGIKFRRQKEDCLWEQLVNVTFHDFHSKITLCSFLIFPWTALDSISILFPLLVKVLYMQYVPGQMCWIMPSFNLSSYYKWVREENE